MTKDDLDAARTRDAAAGALWFKGPESFTALAARDRRALLAEVDRLMNDVQELTCGDPRKVCPNCRDAVEPSEKQKLLDHLFDVHHCNCDLDKL